MKRSPLPPRKTRLQSSRVRIRSRKADPARRRFAKHRDPEWCAKVRETACVIPPLTIERVLEEPGLNSTRGALKYLFCWGRTECAHVKPRSTGGADRGNTLGLCKRHHAQQHAIGLPAFEKLYRLNLSEIAQSLDVQFPAASVAGRDADQ